VNFQVPTSSQLASASCKVLRQHGRTDVQNEEQLAADLNLKAVDAGAHTANDIESVGQIIDWLIDVPTGTRHPIARTGQRDEIPPHVRSAVFLRDHGRCEFCGDLVISGAPWHLDHITPWSAGGSDSTTNLRVLCERHNLERSNFVTWQETPRRGATWWCLNCWAVEWEDYQYSDWLVLCPTHGGAYCNVTRGLKWAFDNGQPNWHRRAAIDEANSKLTVAWCAHCNAPGLTDVVL